MKLTDQDIVCAMQEEIAEQEYKIEKLQSERDELLEACKAYDKWADNTLCYDWELLPIRAQIRAAIAKAEGSQS